MKKYLLFFFLLAIGALGFGFYQYNKPHQNMEQAGAAFQINATQLFAAFEKNEKAAELKYLDQILQVSGEITNVSQKADGVQTITLQSEHLLFGVLCELDPLSEHPENKLKKGETISLKGICTGMLSDVVLVRCVIL